MQDNTSLGKWGILYKNYLREYKSEFYNDFKKSGKLLEDCKEREIELMQLAETIDKQIREKHPRPVTDSFLELAQYEHFIASTVNELVQDNISF